MGFDRNSLGCLIAGKGVGKFFCRAEDLKFVEDTDAKAHSENHDGGPGSGNFGHKGVPGQVGGSAPSGSSELSKAEDDAVAYWKQGNNGRAYSDIRAIANGQEAPSVTELKKNGNGSKADYYEKELSKITKDFDKAVTKCPSVEGKTLVRVESTYAIPKVGEEVSLPKYTSFSKEPNQALYDRFGVEDGLVYRVKGTSSFKDISAVGKATTDSEKEAITDKKLSFKVVNVTTENVGGESTWLGIVGGKNYTFVDIEPITNSDGGPGSGNH